MLAASNGCSYTRPTPGIDLVPEAVPGPDVDAGGHVVADRQRHRLHALLAHAGVEPDVDLGAAVVGAAAAHRQVAVRRLAAAAELPEPEGHRVPAGADQEQESA